LNFFRKTLEVKRAESGRPGCTVLMWPASPNCAGPHAQWRVQPTALHGQERSRVHSGRRSGDFAPASGAKRVNGDERRQKGSHRCKEGWRGRAHGGVDGEDGRLRASMGGGLDWRRRRGSSVRRSGAVILGYIMHKQRSGVRWCWT
jgi:hypothetical protein